MILSFSIGRALAPAALVAALVLPVRAAPEAQPLRRVVALLDYVAGDYPRAVGPNGGVLSAAEHGEQLSFVEDAARELRADAGEQGEDLARKLDALHGEIAAARPPDQVVPRARETRDEIARRFGIVVAPTRPPDVARGAQLYAQACAACHGADGHPGTALKLDPPARAFASPEETKDLSPKRAFAAVTYGVPRTAMPSFEEAFDEPSRWDLAQYVHTLSKGPGTARGFEIARQALVPSSYAELSALTDAELDARLTDAGVPEPDRALALAALRAGPFPELAKAQAPQGLAQARRGVQRALTLARAGKREDARRELTSAYLDHFEPVEAGLRARDRDLVDKIEAAFLALRASFTPGGGGGGAGGGGGGGASSSSGPDTAAARLDSLLEKADSHAPGGQLVAFVAALAIALREGVEAALLVAAMLAFLRKADRERDARAVHVGWTGALLAGAALWWLSGALLFKLSGSQRELWEAILQLVTAALLLYASHWLLAAMSAKRLVSFLSAKTRTAGNAAVILGLTFLAVFREMFELVLFFRGLLLESPGAGPQVALGAACGLVALAGLVVLFQKVGRRLQPRPLLIACGLLLCGLAVLMVGNGIRGLQVIGAVPLTVWGAFQLPALGVYATREGLLAQALVLVALAASALWTVARGDGGKKGGPSGAAAAAA